MSITPMHDETAVGLALGDSAQWFVPDEGQAELLGRWTKYERLEGTGFIRFDDDRSLCAVQSPQTEKVYLVLRTIVDRVDIGNNKTWLKLEITGARQVVDTDEAKAVLDDVRNAWDFKVARDLEGFGDAHQPGEESAPL